MKQNAISQLMKKKVQIENLKEFSMITFPMTKEKFDSIPDNLMIRKLVVSYSDILSSLIINTKSIRILKSRWREKVDLNYSNNRRLQS